MANIDLEMGQFQKVTTLENKDYIVVSLDNGTQGQIKVSDLASVVAALVNGIGDIFYSSYHKGTVNLNNPSMVAQEVIDALPSLYRVTFMVIHGHAGERLVYGYLYSNKLYGTIFITSYQGVSYVFDVVNGEIKSR